MNVDVEINAREVVPRWLGYGTPVFTVVAALAVSALALVALDVDPIAAYDTMFVQTSTTAFGVEQTLVKAVPLILTGLAVYLPLRGGLWNIGAEGQLYVGAIVGTWIGINVSGPPALLVPLMIVGGMGMGGVWAFIPAWLRAKWGVNEIITTLLLVFVGIEVTGYVVRGPMQGGAGNFPVSEMLPEGARLPMLFGTEVHAGILVALLCVGALYVVMEYTRLGFEVTFVGANHEAAEQAGMSSYRVYLFVLVAGGALAGIAGVSEIAGVQNRLRPGFSPGYGFTAIPIALLGRNGAFRVVLAALFFAVLFIGGDSIEVIYEVPAALVDVIQALVILFLITAEFFKRYSVDVSVGEEIPETPVGDEEVA
jgi:simple sugar transport system permease protein